MKKHPLSSKMILFNSLIAGLATLEANIGVLRGIVDPIHYLTAMVVVNIVNVYLRSITTKPIGFEK